VCGMWGVAWETEPFFPDNPAVSPHPPATRNSQERGRDWECRGCQWINTCPSQLYGEAGLRDAKEDFRVSMRRSIASPLRIS